MVTNAEQGSPQSHLSVRDLEAWYDDSQVLHGINFDAARGQVTTLLGRNGAGKTTVFKSIMGMVQRRGSVKIDGFETSRSRSYDIARHGIALVPEDRGIFSSLTVRENLMLPPQTRPGGLPLEQIFSIFPNIAERLENSGGKLSGGEQQMLAIARVLRTGATILLLDEPTEGLAPVIVNQIRETIHDLKLRGFTILLVEQNIEFAASIANRHFIIEQGQVVDELDQQTFNANYDRIKSKLAL